jgi:type IV secretory pathway VirJ component
MRGKSPRILWEVKEHHPEHLKAICERAKIGRSRRKELLQIGRGSKTVEQSRKESAERQTRSRANKKARAVTVTAPASPHAANETDAGPTAKPKPAPSNSVEALAQFKVACDHWLPLLNERDQDQASTHANSMFEKLKNSRSSPGEAA